MDNEYLHVAPAPEGSAPEATLQDSVTLYSPQAPIVWETVLRDGISFSKREYIQKKYGESATIFLAAYEFYVREAQNYARPPEPGSLPAGIQIPPQPYPYWAFLHQQDLDGSAGGNVMKLRVPLEETVFFDMYDWQKILRLSYMGESPKEEKDFLEQLQCQGIKDPSQAFLTAFYPGAKMQIQRSWKRLFRWDAAIRKALKEGSLPASAGSSEAAAEDAQSGALSKDVPLQEPLPHSIEAGLWCIKKEWLLNP